MIRYSQSRDRGFWSRLLVGCRRTAHYLAQSVLEPGRMRLAQGRGRLGARDCKLRTNPNRLRDQ